MNPCRWVPLALPSLWLALAGGQAAFGSFSVDLAGHLWMGWSAARGPLTHTTLLSWPDGLDLMPVLGGWLDVALVGSLSPSLGLLAAYNLVAALYLVVAGLGGAALARRCGAGPGAAAVAGVLLQLDGFVLHHLAGGRPEQVGLGFVALALALALGAWRGDDRPWLAGLAGALVVFVSWELTLLLAGLVLALGATLALTERVAGAWRRWAQAAGVFALAAGPWIATFLSRAGAVRAVDEGSFALDTAARASVGLLSWFEAGSVRPSWGALFALAALPALCPKERRGQLLALMAGLGALLALALGPWPGLWAPTAGGLTAGGLSSGGPAAGGPAAGSLAMGSSSGEPWGPFYALQGLPLLGWFHWPDRLLAPWGVAAAVAAALAVRHVSQRHKLAGVALAAALIGGAVAETTQAGRWPTARFSPERSPGPVALGELTEPGAVVDLPIQPDAVNHLPYMMEQMTHARPIMFHMVLDHLDADTLDARVSQDTVLSWFSELSQPTPPAKPGFSVASFGDLYQAGVRFVVLHQPGWPGDRWAMADRALREALGEPVLSEGPQWQCWRLPEP